MLQQFMIDWKLSVKSFLAMLAIQAVAALFGVIMTFIIMSVDEDPGGWFCMGTLICTIILCVIIVFFYGFSYAQEFQLALSMGRTRLAFLGAYALRLVIQLLAGYLLALVVHRIELRLYPALFPGFENDYFFWFLTDWHILLPFFVGLPILSLFMGALFGRFGKNGMWFFYVLWLFCCLVLPRMADVDAGGTGALDRAAYWTLSVILAVPVGAWIALGVLLAAGMIAAVAHFAMVQMVK